MKKLRSLFLLLILLAFAGVVRAQVQSPISIPPNGNNQRAEVSQWIGPVKVSIEYHSPNLHGGGGADRSGHIWGEVVQYGFSDDGFGPTKDKPWRTGANETTTITLSHDVRVEGKDLKAGTYGLFLDAEKSGPWNWIFSTNWAGWGSYQYDPKNDALRVAVNPQAAPHTEFMTFGFDERQPDSTVAFVQWDEKRIPFKIEVPNVNELYVADMRRELQGWAGFNYQNWQQAAQFCAANKINLDEALIWAEKAIREPFRGAAIGSEDFSTVETKAAVLQAMGRIADADATMEKAMTLPGADLVPVHFYGARLLAAGRNEKALEVFKRNQQKYPEEKFVTYLGLARAYTTLGDKENAIKNWETALQNVPDNRKAQIPVYEKALKQLKEGK
jgi:tetratricopeptide (TPR) repeat protein